jgi:antagonist of KipI
MAAVVVLRPGLFTTVQDLGRRGHQASGVSVSGAMDTGAHRRANQLVGNEPSAATLEVTLTGPELQFEEPRRIGVAGADFNLTLDGRRVPVNGLINAPHGSRLAFGARRCGARAYVAIAGGVNTPLVLGSRSTHVPSALGGFEGRALRSGDRLVIGVCRAEALRYSAHRTEGHTLPDVAQGASAAHIRVLRGPDLDVLADGAFDSLVCGEYTVDPDSNRMGYRLRGAAVHTRTAAAKLSEPVSFGTIQVTPSGQPLLLMADCPTTGGYPVVANVVTADLDIAGQLAPGDAVRFIPCSFGEARAAAIDRDRALRALEAR